MIEVGSAASRHFGDDRGCTMDPQQPAGPQFLKLHCNSVRGVAFHPKDRYIFATCGYDGKVNICSAKDRRLIYSVSVRSANVAKNLNAVRFTYDGAKVLVTSTSKRLTVIDLQTGVQTQAYDNCTFSGRDRAALATEPGAPDTAACTGVNGKGLAVFDLRTALPVKLFHNLESNIIRDITFLPRSWPWCGDKRSLLYVSSSGTLKVSNVDTGAAMFSLVMPHKCNTVTSPSITGYSINHSLKRGVVAVAGDHISVHDSGTGVNEQLSSSGCSSFWKIRYTQSGGNMYCAGDDGAVLWHRVTTQQCGAAKHEYRGELYRHSGDVQDMDISPYDEYLVTASKDKSIGIMKIGRPNHGCTEYYELS